MYFNKKFRRKHLNKNCSKTWKLAKLQNCNVDKVSIRHNELNYENEMCLGKEPITYNNQCLRCDACIHGTFWHWRPKDTPTRSVFTTDNLFNWSVSSNLPLIWTDWSWLQIQRFSQDSGRWYGRIRSTVSVEEKMLGITPVVGWKIKRYLKWHMGKGKIIIKKFPGVTVKSRIALKSRA